MMKTPAMAGPRRKAGQLSRVLDSRITWRHFKTHPCRGVGAGASAFVSFPRWCHHAIRKGQGVEALLHMQPLSPHTPLPQFLHRPQPLTCMEMSLGQRSGKTGPTRKDISRHLSTSLLVPPSPKKDETLKQERSWVYSNDWGLATWGLPIFPFRAQRKEGSFL